MIQQGALSGIRVLDLSRMLPGPYCSMILADHGADVIAIEDRKFLQDGLFFNDLNRNKRHMSLNLKTSKGLEVFFKLAERADVILEGFRPGVVARLGIDYEKVKERNPGIVYCSISGFGQTGAMRNKVGHDVNYLSMAGVLDLVGEKGKTPVIPGVQVADIAGGSMNAAVGILLALFTREKNGIGQYIDISMTDGLLGLLSLPYFFSMKDGKQPQSSDSIVSHRYACYNTYETKDGRYLSIGALEKRFWAKLCVHLQCPEYIEMQYEEERKEEAIAHLRKVFLTKDLSEWETELGGVEVCFAPVQRMQDVLQDPFFREREMVHSYQTKEGETRHAFGIPVKMSETPGSIRTTPGEFAEDTRGVLLESGYTEQEINTFFTEGVV